MTSVIFFGGRIWEYCVCFAVGIGLYSRAISYWFLFVYSSVFVSLTPDFNISCDSSFLRDCFRAADMCPCDINHWILVFVSQQYVPKHIVYIPLELREHAIENE